MNNAQQMAKLGFTVFPLAGKKPAVKEWQDSQFKTSDELADFEGNYGVLLDGWTVVDFDPRNFRPGDPNPDEDFVWYVIQSVRAELGLDDTTFEVYSGRGDGGLHLYFLGEMQTRKLGPGVDLKSGHGHYMVGPGSIHPETGEPYTIAGHSLSSPAALPDEAREAINAKMAERAESSESDGASLGEDGIAEGGRNDGLFRHLSKMWGQVPMTEHELRRYGAVVNELDVKPPLEADELNTIIEQVLKYPAAVLKTMLGGSLLELGGETDPDNPFPLLSREDIAKLPKPVWCIDKLVPEQGIGQIFGPSYSGKSFVAIDMAHRVAQGGEWNGAEIVKPGPVVYVAMEGGFDLGQRLDAWYALNDPQTSLTLPVSFLVESDLFNLSDMERTLEFAEEVKLSVGQPAMLFIDTQSLAASGIDENDNTQMSALMRRGKELSKLLGCFVWLVHHTPKTSKKDDIQGRGASSQYASMDVVLKVSPQTKTASRMVEATKIKAGRLPEHPWTFKLVEVAESVAVEYMTARSQEELVEEMMKNTPEALSGAELEVWQALEDSMVPRTIAGLVRDLGPEWDKKRVKNTMSRLHKKELVNIFGTTPDGANLWGLLGRNS